jgi:hypothetical protein
MESLAFLARQVVTALLINVFFRRSFTFSDNYLQFILLVPLALALLPLESWQLLFSLLLIPVLFHVMHTILRAPSSHLGIHKYDLQDMYNFVCTLTYLSFSKPLLDHHAWVSVPLLSLFQLVRSPSAVGEALRPIRVGLGPASSLNAFLLGLYELQNPSSMHVVRLIAIVCALSSFAAVVLFRPDNTEVLEAVVATILGRKIPNRKTIKTCHAVLNITSVVGATIIYVILENTF